MGNIRIPRGWEIPEREATPETLYWRRREFLTTLGVLGAGLILPPSLVRAARAAGAPGRAAEAPGGAPGRPAAGRSLYPAPRDPRFVLDRPLTDEQVAGTYNNFYEFTEQKGRVKDLVGRFKTRPWRIQVAGLVSKPKEVDTDELLARMPVEERLYRHRCVEAWAMAVPWTGFPMRELVKWAEPLSSARYVRMVSFLRPDEAPGQKTATWYPWPYHEALSRAEATNELAFLVCGVYGHTLPSQHGAPLRLATPWKYGFKSIKSVVRFEFTEERPHTFWNDVAPDEYDFLANVNPKVPHERWSQASERMIGTGERRPTLPFNGYGEWVAGLYTQKGEPVSR
jgi:sulfoxide reductase catalytic subunit YedY